MGYGKSGVRVNALSVETVAEVSDAVLSLHPYPSYWLSSQFTHTFLLFRRPHM